MHINCIKRGKASAKPCYINPSKNLTLRELELRDSVYNEDDVVCGDDDDDDDDDDDGDDDNGNVDRDGFDQKQPQCKVRWAIICGSGSSNQNTYLPHKTIAHCDNEDEYHGGTSWCLC